MDYLIHDNGGRPFLVRVESHQISVYRFVNNTRDYGETDALVTMIDKPIKVFIDINEPELEDSYPDDWMGNSILVQTGDIEYTYIGPEIYKFETRDPILQYYSPIGSNDVPYPFSITKQGDTILMEEHATMKNIRNGYDRDKLYAYKIYYGDKAIGTPFDYTVLHK